MGTILTLLSSTDDHRKNYCSSQTQSILSSQSSIVTTGQVTNSEDHVDSSQDIFTIPTVSFSSSSYSIEARLISILE